MKMVMTILTAAMVLATSVAHAVTDQWEKSSNDLANNYRISDAKKNTFTLSCTSLHNEKDILLHHVKVTSSTGTIWDSLDESTNISIYYDGDQYPIPHYVGWRHGHITWLRFINALIRSETFEVYADNQKVATFSPGTTNAYRTLRGLNDCITITYEG